MTFDEAVATVRVSDTLAVPLGPGVPGKFVHALGAREDFVELEVFGALLPDLLPQSFESLVVPVDLLAQNVLRQ